ncbi:hypothetical protein QBC35DRAFT_473717 [Podospora australis]|uniref:Uncharacterized protein n=1 Tax=Podospora australis TaxID=1536484 RepID=A0AAN6WY65_9PEZI|nr:hypothetical protein QBC35DRAFT_473717 [Podospora australis]
MQYNLLFAIATTAIGIFGTGGFASPVIAPRDPSPAPLRVGIPYRPNINVDVPTIDVQEPTPIEEEPTPTEEHPPLQVQVATQQNQQSQQQQQQQNQGNTEQQDDQLLMAPAHPDAASNERYPSATTNRRRNVDFHLVARRPEPPQVIVTPPDWDEGLRVPIP